MLEAVVIETQKQHVKVGVTQSLDVGITTTRVETIVTPNINVVKRGILIGFLAKFHNGSNGVSVVRNLTRSSTLPTIITKVIGTPQMVFTSSIMTTHVNKIAN
jgi:hypothetical protein